MTKNILQKMSNNLRPDENSAINAEKMLKVIRKSAKKLKLDVSPVLGGSLAKGTNLKDNYDIDIFVRFDLKYSKKNISLLLGKILKNANIKAIKVHGSRDYFQVKNKYLFEIVPVLAVDNFDDAKNVADMSPLHVKYFVKKAKNSKKVRDNIRLTKAFLKSARIYGAESFIKGFSGHVADILILYYGSFEKLIVAVTKWRGKVIIDIENKQKNALMSMNASKIDNPLIVVDPVQKGRNAAAAVSEESFKKFIKTAKAYLKKPSLNYFIEENFDVYVNSIFMKKKRNNHCFKILVKPLIGKEDVIGSKILKIKEYIDNELINNDFNISWSDWKFDEKESIIAYCVKKELLSKQVVIQGPPNEFPMHVKDFKKKHPNNWTKKGAVFAKEKRKHLTSFNLISYVLKRKYVSQRCKLIILEQN